jgi:hypothetical protein
MNKENIAPSKKSKAPKEPLDHPAATYGITLNVDPKGKRDIWNTFRDCSQTAEWKRVIGWFRIKEEVGTIKQHYHIQGVVRTRKGTTWDDLHKLLPKGTHIEYYASAVDVQKGVDYLTDDEEDAMFTKVTKRQPRSIIVGQYPAVYTGKDIIKSTDLYDWQRDLRDELELPADPRKIIWYCDPEGNSGKTAMLKYLVRHYDVAWSAGGGSINDIAFAADSQINSTTAFIIDYPMQVDIDEDVNYDALEKFKDGLMSINKYKSRNATFKTKHVVVFSNKEPNYSKMSADRWDIRILKNKELISGRLVGGDSKSASDDESGDTIITEAKSDDTPSKGSKESSSAASSPLKDRHAVSKSKRVINSESDATDRPPKKPKIEPVSMNTKAVPKLDAKSAPNSSGQSKLI